MFSIEVPEINLDKIYESGQNARWIKLKNKKYVIINGEKVVKVLQQKGRLIFNCSEEDFFNIWFNYFNLNKDFVTMMLQAKRIDNDMKIKMTRAKGIRLLKLDCFESLAASVLIASGLENIKGKLDILAVRCGTEHLQAMREDGRINWFAFPTAEQILEKKKELIDECNIAFGYRIKSLIAFCEDVFNGYIDLEEFQSITSKKKLKEYLSRFEHINIYVHIILDLMLAIRINMF